MVRTALAAIALLAAEKAVTLQALDEARTNMMRTITLGAVAMIAAFVILLAAAIALVLATFRVAQIASALARATGTGAELIFGAGALLVATYIATRFAVGAFGSPTLSPALNAEGDPQILSDT